MSDACRVVVNGETTVDCVVENGEYRLLSPGGEVVIAPDGSQVLWPEPGSGVSSLGLVGELARELALALSGTFCLHASAVSGGPGVVAFVGPSGTGKSTLATLLGTGAGSPWTHFSDDVLAVTLRGRLVVAVGASDRVKLPVTEAPFLGGEERGLAAVYVLEAGEGPRRSQARSISLRVGHGSMALVKNTLGARLFSGELLEKHFRFCLEVAGQVPVRRLLYPWSREAGTLVSTILDHDLAASPGLSSTPP